ncbi:MAG: hypothetical protein U1E76_24080 [Planctomycetota bacterium]
MMPMNLCAPAALVFALAAPLASSQETAAKPQAPPPQEKTISVNFAGGTLVDYAHAVQQAAQALNVILMPGSEDVQLGPVVLKDVTPRTAFESARALVIARDRFEVSARVIGKDNMPVFIVEYSKRSNAPPADDEQYLRVFSIKELTDPMPGADHIEPVKAETILTAIDTAFGIAGYATRPTLKYHADSGLILVKATNPQIRSVDEVIDNVRNDMRRRREASLPGADLKKQLKDAQARIAALEDELAKYKKQ